MGRGRAKAKQTKVARDLKYRTYETDFERLQRELQEQTAESGQGSDDRDEVYEDPYAPGPYGDPHEDGSTSRP